MKNKKLSAFFGSFILLFFVFTGIVAYGITTTTLSLPGAEAYKSYEYQIELDKVGLDDGDTYTFRRPDRKQDRCDPGIWPAGINVDTNGKIYGIPKTNSSFKKINVLAVSTTDASKRVLIKCSLTISARQVNITVTGGTFQYDGSEHKAIVNVYDAVTGEEIENVTPKIQYGSNSSLTSVTEAGSYGLTVIIPGCRVQNRSGDNTITITALSAPSITVDSKAFPYDGEEHGINNEDIHIDDSYSGDYMVEYKLSGQSDAYYTAAKPKELGVYTVRVRTTNSNYYTATVFASLNIYSEEVDFIVSNNLKEYNGSEQEPDVTPSRENVGFSCIYRDEEGNTIEGKPKNAGRYTIEIILDDPKTNSIGRISDTNFTITPASVNFIVGNPEITYGDEILPEVAIAEGSPQIPFSVSYKKQGSETVLETVPVNAGTYDIIITFDDSDNYTVGTITSATFKIKQKEVSLKIPQKTYYMADENNNPLPQHPVVVPEPEGFTGYKVKYQHYNESGVPEETLLDYLSDIGTYKVIFTLDDPDNYTFGTGNAQFVEVAEKTIDFTFTDLEKTYKRDVPQYATVTAHAADETIYENHYTVVYTQNNTIVEEPINAGRYYITIQPIHGHGVGTKDPQSPYLEIKPCPVTFSVEDGTEMTIDYDGQEHSVNILHDTDIHADEYTVKYRNQATGIETDSVREAGKYNIIITVDNANYELKEGISETLTVKSAYSLNPGNSPAAMIFKDDSKDDAWKERVFNEFKEKHEFLTEEDTPADCKTGIHYTQINEKMVDTDLATVIVTDIDQFTDPGIIINGIQQTGTLTPVEECNGLYEVNYTVDDETITRYVLVINDRIGDANRDGYVNAIDANYLDGKNGAPNGVTEARIWDVNKDGILNRADANAIRNRFTEKLVPFYPWVINK